MGHPAAEIKAARRATRSEMRRRLGAVALTSIDLSNRATRYDVNREVRRTMAAPAAAAHRLAERVHAVTARLAVNDRRRARGRWVRVK